MCIRDSFITECGIMRFSLHYVCIRSLGIILTPYATFVPNLVSFVVSIAELAHGEKLHTQSLDHSSIMQLI